MLPAIGLVLASPAAFAQDESPTPTTTVAKSEAPKPAPALHHAPHSAVNVGDDLVIAAIVERADLVKRALLVYRGQSAAAEVEFQRSNDDRLPYVAVIPKDAVKAPGLSYSIELDTVDGKRLPVFASRETPHQVTVLDSPVEAREALLLRKLDNRRSVVQASSEYVDFGHTTADVPIAAPDGSIARTERRRERDRYYRIEGSFTYRMLGVVSEFGLRGGIIRGHSLVPNEADPSKYDVGANYGSPRLRLRAQDWLHFEGELITSVTEVGFSSGGGGAVLVGDPYGSKLTFGFEAIQVFGARGYTKLDVVANKRLTISPIIEVTGMPHADRAGIRLLGDAHVALGYGFQVDVRGGYQARSFEQGGPTLGAGASYAF